MRKRPQRIVTILQTIFSHGFTDEVAELEAYITELEHSTPPEQAQGNYQPKQDYETPPVGTDTLRWVQPAQRAAPVWSHRVTCPYCNVTETIETYSPKPPAHCSKEACTSEHKRILARERKRRQRARDKARRKKRSRDLL